jgi:hypothetical protein
VIFRRNGRTRMQAIKSEFFARIEFYFCMKRRHIVFDEKFDFRLDEFEF